jgi:hypothetical protein
MKINPNRSIGWNLDNATVEISERIFNGPDCYHWREVFALWPVKTVGGKYIWLRKVYKQRFWAVWGKGFHMEPTVEYAELFEVLKSDHTQ